MYIWPHSAKTAAILASHIVCSKSVHACHETHMPMGVRMGARVRMCMCKGMRHDSSSTAKNRRAHAHAHAYA